MAETVTDQDFASQMFQPTHAYGFVTRALLHPPHLPAEKSWWVPPDAGVPSVPSLSLIMSASRMHMPMPDRRLEISSKKPGWPGSPRMVMSVYLACALLLTSTLPSLSQGARHSLLSVSLLREL